MTFKEFLLAEREMSMEIDPDDPSKARQQIANAHRNPDKAARQGVIDANQAKREAQKEHDPIAVKIANLRAQLKALEIRQAQKQKTESPTGQ